MDGGNKTGPGFSRRRGPVVLFVHSLPYNDLFCGTIKKKQLEEAGAGMKPNLELERCQREKEGRDHDRTPRFNHTESECMTE